MFKKNKVFLPSLLAMAISSTLSATEVFDIKVSYYDTFDSITEARKKNIEDNIRNLADAVYESTNGAHRIGKVEIYTDAGNKDNADVVWVASCWPNAHISGRGRSGMRIEHCDNFPNGGSPMSFLSLPRSGGYTMAHEWGHFTYALYDEYQNSSNVCDPVNNAGSPCKDDVGIEGSLMNSHWAAIGENDGVGNLNALNFSTKLNNKAPDILTTAQARIYKASGWDTLLRDPAQDPVSQNRKLYADLAAVAPAAGEVPRVDLGKAENGIYVIDTTVQNTAREKVSFEWKRGNQGPTATRSASDMADKIPMVKTIVIDHSANVHANQLKAVKAAVSQFIQQSELGDTISIIAFSNDAHVISPLIPIRSETDKKNLIAAVKTIQATNQPPALGIALQKALTDTQAAASAVPAAAQYDKDIYLFAHGFNSVGLSPKEVAPQIKEANMRIFSFALNEPTEGFLRKLSEQTDGKTWLAPNLETLTNALSGLAQAASPMVDVILASDQSSLTANKDFPFYVDSTLGELDISINYNGAAEGVTFNLVAPNGTIRALTADECQADDNVEGKNACSATVISPAAGEWKLQATFLSAPLSPIDISFNIKALPNENGKVFFASVNTTPEPAAQNKPVLIEASVTGEGAVTGEEGAKSELPIAKLTVSGNVKKPDGTMQDLTLRDDGTNGDRKANDGVYTASMTPSALGQYAVTVKLDNKSGAGQLSSGSINYAPSSKGKIPQETTTPITDKFERVVQAQVIVKPTLQNHERVMNWAESMFAQLNGQPLLVGFDKQDMGIPPYKVRFYPQSSTYLGFNPNDGKMYVYNPAIFGANVVPVGDMTGFLTEAQKAEF